MRTAGRELNSCGEKMAKSWESQQRKTCRKKQAFKSVMDAAVRVNENWRNNKIMTHVYQCDVCDRYHLTSGGLK